MPILLVVFVLIIAVIFINLEEYMKMRRKTGGAERKFPIRSSWDNRRHLRESFARVQNYSLRITETPYSIKNIPDYVCLYRGKPTLINVASSDYEQMTWLSDWFNHAERMKCKRYDEEMSPWDYFMRNGVKGEGKGAADNVYRAMRGCGNFRPHLMRGLIKYFHAASVLDPSAGWGDRLLGAMAAGVVYHGVDPNTSLQAGYSAMVAEFGDPSKHIVWPSGFEDFSPPQNYDLVMTSPPYFNLEVYSDAPSQSTMKYQKQGDWFNHFLLPYIKKAHDHLNPSGYLCININDIRGEPSYVLPMIGEVSKYAEFLGVMAYSETDRGRIRSPQPIWIWQKK